MTPPRRNQYRRTTRPKAKPAKPSKPEQNGHHTLECNEIDLMFLRALLAGANVGPAELKVVCGQLQQKVEAIIGPMPTPG